MVNRNHDPEAVANDPGEPDVGGNVDQPPMDVDAHGRLAPPDTGDGQPAAGGESGPGGLAHAKTGPYDPGEHDVAGVLEHLEAADEAETRRVLDAERAGKARKGVLDQADKLLAAKEQPS
jgi:hypothetical protein